MGKNQIFLNPLMLVYLVLWHYNYTGDIAYLMKNYDPVWIVFADI